MPAVPKYDDIIPIVAKRNAPFFDSYAILYVDWVGSTFKGQIRHTKDTTGLPLIDFTPGISMPYRGTATVAAHVAAGRLESDIYQLINQATNEPFVDGDNLTLSQLAIALDIPSVEDVPIPEEPGDDAKAWYDIVRLVAGAVQERVMEGPFFVRAGVYRP